MGSPRTAVAPGAPLHCFVALMLAACSGGGGGGPAPLTVTIVATIPANGATAVEPDSTITLTLANATQVLQAADVVVRDGGSRLPGTLAQVGATADWIWTPDEELPRGVTIDVGSVQQGVVAAFGVRDVAAGAEFVLPDEEVDTTLCWSNGRRAVRTQSGRVVEVTASGLVDRFVAMPVGARAVGDGDFIGETLQAGVRYCVRGNLDGTIDLVPTPLGVAIGEHNEAGDVVAFVPNTVGVPAEHGLWRLLRSATAFEMAGPLSLALVRDEPSIGTGGTVALAYPMPGIVRVSTFAVGDLVGVHDDLAIGVTDAHYDMGADGRGVLAFSIYDTSVPSTGPLLRVRLARHEPGVGLQLLPQELRNWPVNVITVPEIHPFWGIRSVQVGELGSAAVLLAYGTSSSGYSLPGQSPSTSTNTNYEVARLEVDGTLVLPSPLLYHLESDHPAAATFGTIGISPRRADVWATDRLSQASTGDLGLIRSRGPSLLLLYQFAQLTMRYGFGFDDSGRGLLSGVEWTPDGMGNPDLLIGTRIVVVD